MRGRLQSKWNRGHMRTEERAETRIHRGYCARESSITCPPDSSPTGVSPSHRGHVPRTRCACHAPRSHRSQCSRTHYAAQVSPGCGYIQAQGTTRPPCGNKPLWRPTCSLSVSTLSPPPLRHGCGRPPVLESDCEVDFREVRPNKTLEPSTAVVDI